MSDRHPGRRQAPAPRILRHVCNRGLLGAATVLVSAALVGEARGTPSRGTIGPGDAHAVVLRSGYRVDLAITPNLGGHITSTFKIELTRNGRPVTAAVSARFTMRAMEMPSLELQLRSTAPGRYRGSGQTLTMPGRWQIDFHFAVQGAPPFDITLVDLVVVE
jgi:hypothetical protein